MLPVNNEIKSSPKEVSEIFNSHFISAPELIGDSNNTDPATHPSINKIESNHIVPEHKYEFGKVSEKDICKIIGKTLYKKIYCH